LDKYIKNLKYFLKNECFKHFSGNFSKLNLYSRKQPGSGHPLVIMKSADGQEIDVSAEKTPQLPKEAYISLGSAGGNADE